MFAKIIRFGDAELIDFLENCTRTIKERNENRRKTLIYVNAKSIFSNAENENELKKAGELFLSIVGFKDAEELSKQAFEKSEIVRKEGIYKEAMNCFSRGIEELFHKGVYLLETIRGFKVVNELLENKEALFANTVHRKLYMETMRKLNLAEQNIRDEQTVESLIEIKELFSSIIDWDDSRQKVELCDKYIVQCKANILEILEKQKKDFEIELRNLKGFFVAKERAQLQAAITKIDEQIRKYK